MRRMPAPVPGVSARPRLRHRLACGSSSTYRDMARGLTSWSLARWNRSTRAPRKRVGSPSGRYVSRPSSKRCSRSRTMASARLMSRMSPGRPSSNAYSRSSRSPKAWKVWTAVSAWPYGTSRSTRACISWAALSVNVSARISRARARLVAMSHARRRVTTSVLPVPGPATTRSGPSPCLTADLCSRFRPRSSPAAT